MLLAGRQRQSAAFFCSSSISLGVKCVRCRIHSNCTTFHLLSLVNKASHTSPHRLRRDGEHLQGCRERIRRIDTAPFAGNGSVHDANKLSFICTATCRQAFTSG